MRRAVLGCPMTDDVVAGFFSTRIPRPPRLDSGMSKQPTLHPWSIYRIRNTPAELLGRVYAPDEKTAIEKAIEEFKITNPAQYKRLIARRVD